MTGWIIAAALLAGLIALGAGLAARRRAARTLDRVWTDGAQFVEENALSVTVRRLRGKLEADPARPEYLKTVYGIGYTWAVTP